MADNKQTKLSALQRIAKFFKPSGDQEAEEASTLEMKAPAPAPTPAEVEAKRDKDEQKKLLKQMMGL